jgi:hypothetical protein
MNAEDVLVIIQARRQDKTLDYLFFVISQIDPAGDIIVEQYLADNADGFTLRDFKTFSESVSCHVQLVSEYTRICFCWHFEPPVILKNKNYVVRDVLNR